MAKYLKINKHFSPFKKAPLIMQDGINPQFAYYGLGDCSELLRNLHSLITHCAYVIEKLILFSQIIISLSFQMLECML